MSTLLASLLLETSAPPESTDVAAYLARISSLSREETSVERAARAGANADRLGYAFAGGYAAAIERLTSSTGRACLCATESGGGHPRAIATRLAPAGNGFTLDGTKTFATMARYADTFLIVASVGEKDGKNELRVVRVPKTREGIALIDLPETPFAPEIPHAELHLTAVGVSADEVMAGDGYDAYLKPFRTIEDIHVLAAAIGYVVRTGRAYGFARGAIEQLLGHLAALVALGSADPLDRGVHAALTGVLSAVRETLSDAAPHWAAAPDDVQRRWLRDSPLLRVADRVRAARADAAWDPGSRRR